MLINGKDPKQRVFFRRLKPNYELNDGKMVVTVNVNDRATDVPTDKGRYVSEETVKQYILNEEKSNERLNRIHQQQPNRAVAVWRQLHLRELEEPTEAGQFGVDSEVPKRIGGKADGVERGRLLPVGPRHLLAQAKRDQVHRA